MKLQRDIDVLRGAGFGVAAISYDSEAVLKEFATRKSITFPLLSDHNSQIIRAYGVADRRYRRGNQLDVDTEMVYTSSIGYVPVYGLAYPSVFVIGPDRKIAWRFVSETSEFRYSAASILHRSSGADAIAASTRVAGKRATVTATSSDARIGLGNRVVLGVNITLPPGLHAYAPQPGGEYQGLSWTMGESKNCWVAGEPAWPAPTFKAFEFSPAKLPVYETTVHSERELVIQPAINPRAPELYKMFRSLCLDDRQQLRIRASVRLQACSERECFPPETIPVEWVFKFDGPDLQRSPVDLRREFEP